MYIPEDRKNALMSLQRVENPTGLRGDTIDCSQKMCVPKPGSLTSLVLPKAQRVYQSSEHTTKLDMSAGTREIQEGPLMHEISPCNPEENQITVEESPDPKQDNQAPEEKGQNADKAQIKEQGKPGPLGEDQKAENKNKNLLESETTAERTLNTGRNQVAIEKAEEDTEQVKNGSQNLRENQNTEKESQDSVRTLNIEESQVAVEKVEEDSLIEEIEE